MIFDNPHSCGAETIVLYVLWCHVPPWSTFHFDFACSAPAAVLFGHTLDCENSLEIFLLVSSLFSTSHGALHKKRGISISQMSAGLSAIPPPPAEGSFLWGGESWRWLFTHFILHPLNSSLSLPPYQLSPNSPLSALLPCLAFFPLESPSAVTYSETKKLSANSLRPNLRIWA